MRKGGGGMRRKYWIALLTAPPGDHCELHEPKAPSYARAETEMLWLPLRYGFVLKNYTPAQFPVAHEDWGTLIGFAVCLEDVGPQFDTWAYFDYHQTHHIPIGGRAEFAVGEIAVTGVF